MSWACVWLVSAIRVGTKRACDRRTAFGKGIEPALHVSAGRSGPDRLIVSRGFAVSRVVACSREQGSRALRVVCRALSFVVVQQAFKDVCCSPPGLWSSRCFTRRKLGSSRLPRKAQQEDGWHFVKKVPLPRGFGASAPPPRARAQCSAARSLKVGLQKSTERGFSGAGAGGISRSCASRKTEGRWWRSLTSAWPLGPRVRRGRAWLPNRQSCSRTRGVTFEFFSQDGRRSGSTRRCVPKPSTPRASLTARVSAGDVERIHEAGARR